MTENIFLDIPVISIIYNRNYLFLPFFTTHWCHAVNKSRTFRHKLSMRVKSLSVCFFLLTYPLSYSPSHSVNRLNFSPKVVKMLYFGMFLNHCHNFCKILFPCLFIGHKYVHNPPYTGSTSCYQF